MGNVSGKMIPLDEPMLDGNEKRYLAECIDTNWISWQGQFCRRMEQLLAVCCDNTQYCFAIVNGTQALIVALQALGIGPGDEVIVPALTMSATAFAVTTVGANIVWVDSRQDSFTLSPEDVARKITPRTKAVMAVHLYGFPVDMAGLLAITRPKGIHVIEDVAEALGAKTGGARVGGIGTIGCHSFHNKIVASGEGGAITLNDSELAARVEELRTPPPDNRDSRNLVLNNRMSNLACAVALAQIERLDELIARRRRVARLYDDLFAGVPGIGTYRARDDEERVYWRYQISLTDEYPLTKEQLVEKLRHRQIQVRPVFTLMSEHPIYKNLSSGLYPNAAAVSACSLDLPSGPKLSEANVTLVADLISHPEKL
jgi:perosamine synthetase